MKELKPIGLFHSVLLFLIPGLAFYFNIRVLVPTLADAAKWNAYIVWMFTGTFLLFGLLFALTFILLKLDGYKLEWRTIRDRLRLKKITWKDVVWIIAGMFLCTLLSALLLLFYSLVSKSFSIDDLKNLSPIKVSPLSGYNRLFFIFMPVFFFFNYTGEEILWRGYILPRQELTVYGKYAWIVNMLLHVVFHMAFGLQAMFFFFPFMLLMPYLAYKRKNTSVSIIIHFLLGAPTQVFIALGILK